MKFYNIDKNSLGRASQCDIRFGTRRVLLRRRRQFPNPERKIFGDVCPPLHGSIPPRAQLLEEGCFLIVPENLGRLRMQG
jgi:hypothetical protein